MRASSSARTPGASRAAGRSSRQAQRRCADVLEVRRTPRVARAVREAGAPEQAELAEVRA